MIDRRGTRRGLLSVALLLALPLSAHAQEELEAGLEVVRLEARPASLTIQVGDSLPLEIIAYDANGEVVDAAIRIFARRGTVSYSGGMVRALASGEYEIFAMVVLPPGAESSLAMLRIPVVVEWPPIARVEIEGPEATLYAGTTLKLEAVARHANGSARPPGGVEWRSADERTATVDAFGSLSGIEAGTVAVTATIEGVSGEIVYEVRPFPGARIEMSGGEVEVRTGDVQSFAAVVRDAAGAPIEDIAIAWTLAYEAPEEIIAPRAPGQILDGRVVADLPGVFTAVASAGPLTARKSFRAVPRDVVRKLDIVGEGRQARLRTTDFWVFEGKDGRDYAITGSKRADGHAFVWDVTDPANMVKTDSVQVDARSVNDIKVSPDARYATMTREGASDRKNGLVLLDLADPAHPKIASEFTDGLTGGVHNAFPTNDYAFALSGGDKYLIIDVRDLRNPKRVGEYNHPESGVHDVWVHDGIAYSAEWGSGIVVVDVGNGRWGGSPENPVFVTNYVIPGGATHAVFPYVSKSTGKFYVFSGDEIMTRRGKAWEGPGTNRGSYANQYDPETGLGGIPLATSGYIQVVDFSDPEHPRMIARYEVEEYGTHNIWVEDGMLFQGYYEGGLRVVDVSGELMGNLYTQGREIAVFKPFDPLGYVPNSPMVWSAMPHKGYIFLSDTNSGLWAVKLRPKERPVM